MNHILALQAAVAKTEADNLAMHGRLDEFRLHISGDKFSGFDGDGDRRDWIATSDVNRWVSYIRDGIG